MGLPLMAYLKGHFEEERVGTASPLLKKAL